jgi:hypothetical protein
VKWRVSGCRATRCSANYRPRFKEIAAQFRGALLKGLVRHLDDEEDLIVPLVLNRGEEALGVAHHGG